MSGEPGCEGLCRYSTGQMIHIRRCSSILTDHVYKVKMNCML